MDHSRSDTSITSAQPDHRKYLIILVIGDIVAFLVFAALGRRSHNVAGTYEILEVIKTAAPFLLGWFAVSPFSRAYRIGPVTAGDTASFSVTGMLRQTAIAWLIAWPVGLLLRALLLQRGIPLSFAIVTLLVNTVILCGWRTAFAWMMARR